MGFSVLLCVVSGLNSMLVAPSLSRVLLSRVVRSEEGMALALECNAVTNQHNSTFAHSNFSNKIHHTPPSTYMNDSNLQTLTNAETSFTTY